ncbi:uncharacterized protein N0V89_004165 [Didymosphaeria variabile]|uniref:Mus7/MMS22 family-domain-containing protein n=1 Tax=Didymosphaeria variabile TaxID=1932322 RepID=A0A9W8XPW3_9PLEO|nr:uncharacterized protein N0V89_004165 [Didymosphaeria variabile]KAJ4356137.1 hypothetical protein N0V89_004165 [Didymosphaeria variabile]
MSTWRVKGFVQDSDEEEEDIESSTASSIQNTRHSIDVRDGNASTGSDHGEGRLKATSKRTLSRIPYGPNDGPTSPPDELHHEGQPIYDAPTAVTQAVEASPRTQPVTPPVVSTTNFDIEAQTESPDPLLGSPTPNAKRVYKPSYSSQILGMPSILQSTEESNHSKVDDGNMQHVLLLDFSEDSELSDPPSDFDELHPQENGPISPKPRATEHFDLNEILPGYDELVPQETIFASPTRRATVQVVIPRSTEREHQPKVFDRYVERSFRQRKPIQMHPYLLEGERYRRNLQGRGVKPVLRLLSPPQKSRDNGQESQEQEFDPDRGLAPNSSPEILVSTPIVRRRTEGDQVTSGQRKLARPHQLTFASTTHSSAKKRRRGQPPRPSAATPQEPIVDGNSSITDMWTVPQSPPYSSSPPINRSRSTVHRAAKMSTNLPVADLPTPSNSSSLPAAPDIESDEELVARSMPRLGQRAHEPIGISSASSSSDAEVSEDEAQASDREIQKVGKRIRGVLPASWLRLDLQAQEKRDKQRKERLCALHSPGQAEPQRGVAQKVVRRQATPSRLGSPDASNNHVIELSDESDGDVDTPAPQTRNGQESAHAAFQTAAVFDHRYADDDSDTMENDRLHLFTLGGGKKRKKQSKLTDVFAASKRRKPASEGNKFGKASSEQHTASRRARRTPPPALSILDVDQSPSKRQAVPSFLRIARRQARRRPDYARQLPTHKYIRLHTAQDTHDANSTLREWRRSAIRPKTNVAQSRRGPIPRRPLSDLDQNQQSTPGNTDMVLGSKRQSLAMRQESSSARCRAVASGPSDIREEEGSRRRHMGEQDASASSRKKQLYHNRPRFLPFRNAQLEGPETDQGPDNRKVAFNRGLQNVARLFDLQQPFLGHSRNHQLTRFLADDDITISPLPTAEDVDKHVSKLQTPKPPGSKKRLVRKPCAQRVDIETRQYRQPSEPVVEDYLKSVPNPPALDLRPVQADRPSLQGLGPRGTRYPTTFDTLPLQDGTYFHVSTFVGSGALHRALGVNKSNGRNMDEAAGYCNLDFLEMSIRCGPWEESLVARLTDLTNDIWNAVTSQSAIDDHLVFQRSGFDSASNIIRSLVDYVSTHLSFHDPIDRNSFVIKMEQWITSMFESIMSSSLADAKSYQLVKAKPMALLLVLTLQVHKVTQHPAVDQPARSDLTALITSIGKSLVGFLLDHVSELNDFLETNKRYKVRENGIQDSDVIVESIVICMHALSEASIPGTTFWELVSLSLSPAAKRATHLMEFESVWGTMFTLLPFLEFNDLGIPTRSRRTSFRGDNWMAIRVLLQRTFALYPETLKVDNASLDDYIRAIMTRCHEIIHSWHWNRCEPVLYAMFDFFVANNRLKHLRKEQSNGPAVFLEQVDDGSFRRIESNARSFHIFLKCLYIGIQGMQNCYAEKKLRSVVLRLIPNHGRSHPKDQPLEVESLEALENHHDILCTLYRASPLPCRPKLDLIKNLVHHENSHREACRIGIRAWANLAKFQLSTSEPYISLQPLAEWHREIMTQTLKQYRLAKTEAEEYLNSGARNKSEATSLMVKQTMEKNQDQVIAALRDCIAGLRKAIGVRDSQILLKEFLMDAGLIQLLELPHLQDRRLVVVIRDALGVLRMFAGLPRQRPCENVVSEQDEESQDYGDSFDLADFMEVDSEVHQPDNFLQNPLWHLLSNAFGAEASPDDNILMDCIDTWCLIARSQVVLGVRSWTYYLDQFSQVSWQQLRRTEQTQKFRPYFMASILGCDSNAYSQHRLDFLNALLVSLVDRESMLRFQYRLLSAIVCAVPDEPLLKNLPFYKENENGSLDVNADTVRTRRLALISSILANMRDDLHNAIHEGVGRIAEVKGSYAAILKDFMNAMKNNYHQLGSGTIVTGAYVQFVQKVVQFLQQYTADIHPVLDFFTNSVAFPLPAADPTYVVGRLCGYAPKLSQPGISKQLSVFVQTVAQQAATGGHQPYLVHQLQTALCTDEAPPKDRDALRDALLQGIFPAYIEAAFTSAIGFVIAQPIIQSLVPIIEAMRFNTRIFDDANVRAICDCLLSVSHAFIRGTEQLKDNDDRLRQPHVLQALALMFQVVVPTVALLEYICGRSAELLAKSLVVEYFESLALFVGETLHDLTPQTNPLYGSDTSNPLTKHTKLLPFSIDGLQSGIDANWSAGGQCIYFGQGHAKREVLVDWSTVEEAKTNLITWIEEFLACVSAQTDDARYDESREREAYVAELDV